MPRRLFIKLLVALGLSKYFPSLAEAAEVADEFTPDGRPYKFLSLTVEQLITSEPRTSRTLMWRTPERLADIFFEYKMIGDKAARSSPVNENFFVDQKLFIYDCRLDGLKSESVYEYRVISGGRATGWKKFSTPGFGNFQALIFTDSQCVDYGVWKSVADRASEHFPDSELVTVLGDLTDNGQYAPGWRGWHEGATKLLSTRIFAPVMGNHECYDPVNWLNCIPVGYLNHFVLPPNGTRRFDGYFYVFDYGAVHFVVLNTQFDELEPLNAGLEAEQTYRLRRDLARVTRPWRVVLMHKDIFDYMTDTFSDVGDRLMPLFDELGIDLVLTGHLHTYRNRGRIFQGRKSERGPMYILCGLSGDQRYTEKVSASFDEVAATPEDNYMVLDASARELRLRCYSIDGTLIDDVHLKK